MKRGLLTVLAFLGGAVFGLALAFGGYLTLTTFGGVFDFEGSMAMGTAFTIGPILALICGVIAAVWATRRIS